jgi:catechol 2,3-dioxygenase-like lactoylglutathione lyase family enzyme
VTSVHETVLYADDLGAATAFYVDVVGLRVVFAKEGFMSALRLGSGGVLLLFDPAESALEGRDVPAHGAHGPGHVAFAVGDAELSALRERLDARGVEVERELTWPRGGNSVYVRDPAGNSVEFVAGEIWPD